MKWIKVWYYLQFKDICILSLGNKFSIRFICEVTVSGHNYVGVGNSTNKKDAQGNASKDYLSYLIRQGLVSADALPSVSLLIFGVIN